MPERMQFETSEGDLIAQFLAHSKAVLHLNELSLTSDGEGALSYLFSMGAAVMVSSQRLTADDRGLAHASVGFFTQSIVFKARTARVAKVDSDIVTRVRDFFCPGFWPFC